MILYFLWKSITLSQSEGIFFLKWFLHAARKSLAAKIFKFVFCSPCESSPSLTKFIIIYLVFSILVDYFFQVSLQIKLNFERGKKENSQCRDQTPLSTMNWNTETALGSLFNNFSSCGGGNKILPSVLIAFVMTWLIADKVY